MTTAMAEAQRMRRLVTDLLLLSQPVSTQVLDVQTVDLVEILTLIVARVQRQWPTAAIAWAPPAACDVRGDPERLTQVLRNVVENAVHQPGPAMLAGPGWAWRLSTIWSPPMGERSRWRAPVGSARCLLSASHACPLCLSARPALVRPPPPGRSDAHASSGRFWPPRSRHF